MPSNTLGPGDVYEREIFTRSATGAPANADATPTVLVYRNNALDVTFAPAVTALTTGVYLVSGTIPAGWAIGDRVRLRFSATVGGSVGYDRDGFRLDVLTNSRNATTPPTAAAIATAVELALLNESDGSAVQQALVDKINAAGTDLGDLTTLAIAQAVRDVAIAGAASGSVGAAIAAIPTTKSGYSLTAAYDPAKTAATQASVDTIDDLIDTEMAAVKLVTDRLGQMMLANGGDWQFDALALALAPSGGGSSPTVQQIVDAIKAFEVESGMDFLATLRAVAAVVVGETSDGETYSGIGVATTRVSSTDDRETVALTLG